MKSAKYIALLSVCALLSGCVSGTPAVEEGISMIRNGSAECVLVKNGKILYAERGHGVSPLMNVYDHHKDMMRDAVLVDKVIGRAAAFIAINGKVRHVHGEVMSSDAVLLLKEHHITSSQTLLVPRILNRKRTGLCPLERSVLNFEDPEKALAALKKTLEQMRGHVRSPEKEKK